MMVGAGMEERRQHIVVALAAVADLRVLQRSMGRPGSIQRSCIQSWVD